jgi:hypothetical protein
MNVVVHEAVGDNSQPDRARFLREKGDVYGSVLIVHEDGGAVVAALSHVVGQSRDDDSRRS